MKSVLIFRDFVCNPYTFQLTEKYINKTSLNVIAQQTYVQYELNVIIVFLLVVIFVLNLNLVFIFGAVLMKTVHLKFYSCSYKEFGCFSFIHSRNIRKCYSNVQFLRKKKSLQIHFNCLETGHGTAIRPPSEFCRKSCRSNRKLDKY